MHWEAFGIFRVADSFYAEELGLGSDGVSCGLLYKAFGRARVGWDGGLLLHRRRILRSDISNLTRNHIHDH